MDAVSPDSLNPIPSSTFTPMPTTRRRIPLALIFIAVFLVFLGLLSVPVAAAYYPGTFAFVPSSVRQLVNNTLRQTPLPKNTEQILMGMAAQPLNVTKIIQETSLNANVNATVNSGMGFSGNAKLGMAMSGPINFSNPINPELQQQLTFNLEVPELGAMDISGEFRLKDRVFYAKIDQLPAEVSSLAGFPENLSGTWYSIDFQDFVSEEDLMSLQAQTQQEQQKLYQKTLAVFSRPEVLSLIEYRGIEKKNDEDAHHLVIDRKGSELSVLVNPLAEVYLEAAQSQSAEGVTLDPATLEEYRNQLNESLKYIDRFVIEWWVGKDNYALSSYHYAVNATVNTDEITQGLVDDAGSNALTSDVEVMLPDMLNFTMDGSWSWRDWDNSTEIIAPSSSQPYETLFQQAYGESFAMANDTKVKSDINSIGTAIQMYATTSQRYPVSLNDLITSDTMSFIPESPYGIDYIYLVNPDGDAALILGTLQYPSDSTKPLWIYMTETGASEASFSDYQNYRDRYNLQESRLIQDGPVLGQRTPSPSMEIARWVVLSRVRALLLGR